MQPVDVALVGHGAWGEKIARTLGRPPAARLSVVCDPSAAARARARALAPGVRLAASLDEVLGTGAPRAAIIATPPATHAALARQALELEAEHFLAGVSRRDRLRSDAAGGAEVVAVLEAGQRALAGRAEEAVSLG